MARDPSKDPSVAHEPHLRPATEAGDAPRDEPALKAMTSFQVDDVEHSVWDEPTLVSQREGAEAPEGQLTYARWLDAGTRRTTWAWSWGVTLLIALASGPWGVVGAFGSSMGGPAMSFTGVLAVALLAPVTEEIVKVAALLWAVEKRPFWFKSVTQILLCALVAGLAFAAIENLIYTHLYVPNGGEAFVLWRWTVCVGLHTGCSFIAGVGLARIWDDAVRNRRRPELARGMPFFAIAMIGHGLYNTAVTLAEVLGLLSFE